MQPITVSHLIERLDTAKKAILNPVLAFDADGTLWKGDVGIECFEAFLNANRVHASVCQALLNEAQGIGISTVGTANEIASKLYEAYNHEKYGDEQAFSMMAWIYAGFTISEITEFAINVFQQTHLEDRFHQSLMPIFEWCLKNHIQPVIVSASPNFIVNAAVEYLNLPISKVLAMNPSISENKIEPFLATPPVYDNGKVTAIQREGLSDKILAAFGDSAYDAPLLRSAPMRIAIEPKPSLRAIANTVPHLLELQL